MKFSDVSTGDSNYAIHWIYFSFIDIFLYEVFWSSRSFDLLRSFSLSFLIFIYLKLLSQIVIFFALLLTSQWTVPPFLDFLPPRHRFCHIRQFLFSDTMSIWLKHRRFFLLSSFSFCFPYPVFIWLKLVFRISCSRICFSSTEYFD